MAEIWPKPTLFHFDPSLNKDNMANAKKNMAKHYAIYCGLSFYRDNIANLAKHLFFKKID
jgi:hypothetical protein